MSDMLSPEPSALPDNTGLAEQAGFDTSPAAWLEAAFRHVADRQMSGLPFYRAAIPVKACGFTLFENQWIGCLLTPWTLSLLILPGPEQVWLSRAPGDRLALQLPCGNVTFLQGEIGNQQGERCQYLSCSLMSPVDKALTPEQGIALAEQSVRMALSLPVADADAPRDPNRRALFHRRGK